RGTRKTIGGQWTMRGARTAGFKIEAYDRSSTLVIDPVLDYASRFYFVGTPNDMAVDATGNVYLAGATLGGLPARNALQPDFTRAQKGSFVKDAFVIKLAANGTLVFATYLGGSDNDYATGIAVDAAGSFYVIGTPSSADLPTRRALQSALRGPS